MTKTIRVTSITELDELESKVKVTAEATLQRILTQLDGQRTGLEVLHSIKFDPIGHNPLSGDNLNLIEQVNQTFTYLASFAAVRHLWHKHPNENGFTVNLGTAPGFDVHNDSMTIVAETFASVKPSNNDKLRKDAKKVHESGADHQYVFYYCPGFPLGERPGLDKYPGVTIISLSLDL